MLLSESKKQCHLKNKIIFQFTEINRIKHEQRREIKSNFPFLSRKSGPSQYYLFRIKLFRYLFILISF